MPQLKEQEKTPGGVGGGVGWGGGKDKVTKRK